MACCMKQENVSITSRKSLGTGFNLGTRDIKEFFSYPSSGVNTRDWWQGLRGSKQDDLKNSQDWPLSLPSRSKKNYWESKLSKVGIIRRKEKESPVGKKSWPTFSS